MKNKSRKRRGRKITVTNFCCPSTNMSRNTLQHGLPTTPTRIATRSKNADTHPGAILQGTRRVRRTKDEINQEKDLKNIQTEAKEQKKVANAIKKARGQAYIAELEDAEDAAIANADNVFPRHRIKKSL